MAIKKFSPTTPSRRYMTVVSREDITKDTPEKSLVEPRTKSGGRNNTGPRDFALHRWRSQAELPRSSISSATNSAFRQRSRSIEYDPNRSARIALLNYADGEKRYIIAPEGLKVGATISSGPEADILVGQRPAAQEYSGRYRGPQYRTAAGQGRADGAFGGHAGSAGFARRRRWRC